MSNADENQSVHEATRLERKRQREKQRRGDLVTAFDELGVLVTRLENNEDPNASSSDRNKRRKASALDVIKNAFDTIHQLKQENVALRQHLAQMQYGPENKVSFPPIELDN
jgi:hypothetical protein